MEFKEDKTMSRKDYDDVKEFKYDRKTNVLPKAKNKLLCLFFSEDKGAYFITRTMDIKKMKKEIDYFVFKNGMYIIDNESIHLTKNGVRIAFYMEGISTPIKMSNIEKITKEVEYTDLFGVKRKSIIQTIKGLKFDSKILNTFANRKFAEIFTATPIDKFQLLMLILTIVSTIGIFCCIGVSYYFR